MNRRTFLAKAIGMALCAAALPALAYTAAATYTPTTRQRGSTQLNVKNYGAIGDGVHDDTAAIQAAINALPGSGGTVYVPAGTYLIDTTKSVRLRSYMLLSLDPGAILKAKTNSATRSYIVYLSGLTQVEVAGGQLYGDRDTHHYVSTSTSEWNHGIQINGGSHITVRDLWTGKHAGDGICCGGAVTDLEIVNVIATNNRRQGLSITHAYGVKVYDSEFSYTRGTAPQCGIDIEPDSPYTASDIHIENCWLHHNQSNGVQVYQRVDSVVLKNNLLEYNTGYGVYTTSCSNGILTGNTLQHNRELGATFQSGTSSYSVQGNTFANNLTRLFGVKTTLGTPYPLTGFISGNGGNAAQMTKSNATTNVVAGTNYFRKAS